MLWCGVVRCSAMQRVAVCCSVLQCVQVCCNVLQRVTRDTAQARQLIATLQHTTIHGNILQFPAAPQCAHASGARHARTRGGARHSATDKRMRVVEHDTLQPCNTLQYACTRVAARDTGELDKSKCTLAHPKPTQMCFTIQRNVSHCNTRH